MKILNHKKSEAFALIFIFLIIIIFFGFLAGSGTFGARECRTNAQCGKGFYCGSDFACHQIPTIEKTVVKNSLIVPSIIIGIAIVIAAIVLKSEKMPFVRKTGQSPNEERQYKNPLKMP